MKWRNSLLNLICLALMYRSFIYFMMGWAQKHSSLDCYSLEGRENWISSLSSSLQVFMKHHRKSQHITEENKETINSIHFSLINWKIKGHKQHCFWDKNIYSRKIKGTQNLKSAKSHSSGGQVLTLLHSIYWSIKEWTLNIDDCEVIALED